MPRASYLLSEAVGVTAGDLRLIDRMPPQDLKRGGVHAERKRKASNTVS
jgi:hypothetical protein